MTDDLIATDHPLTAAQQRTLSALLDTLIPASDDGVMPSAAELDLVSHLNGTAADFIPVLSAAIGGFDADFAGLPRSERHPIVESFSIDHAELFNALLFHVYACYYQNDRVLVGIGSAAGPPFPRGNTIDAGDLSLLDPVVKQSRTYRRVDS